MFPLVLALVQLSTAASASTAPRGFVELSGRPSEADFLCANYTRNGWVVASSGGEVQAELAPSRSFSDPLPFSYEPGENQIGERHVVKVKDGWLVGFDAGEFGGGLWWFSENGRRSTQVSPPKDAPVHPDDIYRAENVRGFARTADRILVLMGLDHLSARSGRVYNIVRAGNRWKLEPFAVLDGSPDAWLDEGDRVLIVTGGGLWEARGHSGARQLHALGIGSVYPGSLIKADDGALYVGMRRYVIRLEETNGSWTETWFVKADCVYVKVQYYDCVCSH
ncbi:MAG TPA: hypothetical protein VEK57_14740 [Thermoanaerobaculia bacterium]|nr:hypothetical protein [Thermoanaerobaculia bacterium]